VCKKAEASQSPPHPVHRRVRTRGLAPPHSVCFEPRPCTPNPLSQSFSRSYGSILPTSLIYIVLSTRGYSPWRPAAVMGTTWRENYSFPRIFKGRQKDTGHSKSTVLFQSEYPISGQTDSRVIRLLRRKDNSSRALCRRLQVQLRCREKSTSRCRNINRLPFRGII
jgi:hypothetical protein